MKKIWFKRKTLGWGWYPATKEGWAILFGFIALVSLNAWRLGINSTPGNTVFWFVGETYLLTGLLILICYKTGEPPKWQWPGRNTGQSDAGGGPPKDEPPNNMSKS